MERIKITAENLRIGSSEDLKPGTIIDVALIGEPTARALIDAKRAEAVPDVPKKSNKDKE